MTQSRFVRSDLNYDATVPNLELIGEAAAHIPESVRQQHAEFPWPPIIAPRNRLIHSYLGIDDDTLWSIISADIPALMPRLRSLAASFKSS